MLLSLLLDDLVRDDKRFDELSLLAWLLSFPLTFFRRDRDADDERLTELLRLRPRRDDLLSDALLVVLALLFFGRPGLRPRLGLRLRDERGVEAPLSFFLSVDRYIQIPLRSYTKVNDCFALSTHGCVLCWHAGAEEA